MKRIIPFFAIVGLVAATLLITGFSSRVLVGDQVTENDRFGWQNTGVVNVYELVAPVPSGWKLRTPGSGDYPGSLKEVELRKYGGFTAELHLSRCVCRAVCYTFNIIPSVSERTLVFPFHSFW